MIAKELIDKVFSCKNDDRVFVAKQEDYYDGNSKPTEVIDVVKENGKLIILTQ